MTNDKTVTMSRELAENLLHCGDTASTITPFVTARLRELLAAPVVERQPVEILQASYHWQDIWVDVDQDEYAKRSADPYSYKVRMVYTAPPELAELQATIARLTADLVSANADKEAYKGEEMNNEIAEEQAKRIKGLLEEIERLKSLPGVPVAVIQYTGYEPSNSIKWLNKGLGYMIPGTKLYASPPIDIDRNPDAWLVTDIHGQKKALRAGAEGIERHRNSGSNLVPLYACHRCKVIAKDEVPVGRELLEDILSTLDYEGRTYWTEQLRACLDKVKELNQ